MKLIANERAKLSATYVNGVAIAVLAVGGLAPAFSGRFAGTTYGVTLLVAELAVCSATSGILHWAARRILKELR